MSETIVDDSRHAPPSEPLWNERYFFLFLLKSSDRSRVDLIWFFFFCFFFFFFWSRTVIFDPIGNLIGFDHENLKELVVWKWSRQSCDRPPFFSISHPNQSLSLFAALLLHNKNNIDFLKRKKYKQSDHSPHYENPSFTVSEPREKLS
jgi:hypothetical protein